MKRQARSELIEFIFYGNYFYGLCAVGLSIEATLQQQLPLADLYYYLTIFAFTVLYYTKAYISDSNTDSANPRTAWYVRHKILVRNSQILFTVLVLFWLVFFVRLHLQALLGLMAWQWLLAFIFPLVAALYYGINTASFANYNLRNIGWLKPFVIGFTWAGLTTVYPVLYHNIIHHTIQHFTWVGAFLFLKNFMFVTVLCIMFDIKDYAMDHNRQLKTFVVKVGLRKTIFYIIIPLCVIGLGSFVYYGVVRHFHVFKLLLNVVPFILLISVAYSLQRRKTILYYLIIIDGLMLVKSICGILAMVYF